MAISNEQRKRKAAILIARDAFLDKRECVNCGRKMTVEEQLSVPTHPDSQRCAACPECRKLPDCKRWEIPAELLS